MSNIHQCPRCGRENEIVNQCRCDPNNLPTRVPFIWCEDEFGSQAEVEHAIACSLVEQLCNGDAGEVVAGDRRYNIEVSAKLVEEDLP